MNIMHTKIEYLFSINVFSIKVSYNVQFIKIISHYKKIGYNIDVLQQTACLVVNPIMVGNFAFLFNCTPVCQPSDSDGSDLKTYLLMRW